MCSKPGVPCIRYQGVEICAGCGVGHHFEQTERQESERKAARRHHRQSRGLVRGFLFGGWLGALGGWWRAGHDSA